MKTSFILGAALLFAIPGSTLVAEHHEEGNAKMEAAADAPAMEEAAPAVQTFKLDPKKTFIAVTTKKGGIGEAVAHNHSIVATQMNGKMSFSKGDDSKNSVMVTIDVNSLSVDNPAHRKRLGQIEGPDADDAASIKENMLAKDQLDGATHKSMSFKSTSITSKGGDKYTVKGDLTIRGVTKSVSFPATVTVKDGKFVGKGKLGITHTQFGFEPYSAAFGAIRNENELSMTLELHGS